MEILHLPAIIIASWDTLSLIYGIFYADAFQQLSLILFHGQNEGYYIKIG